MASGRNARDSPKSETSVLAKGWLTDCEAHGFHGQNGVPSLQVHHWHRVSGRPEADSKTSGPGGPPGSVTLLYTILSEDISGPKRVQGWLQHALKQGCASFERLT